MKKIYEDIKKVFESRASFRILCIVGILLAVLLIFSAGVFVGFRKASFDSAWEENYEKNFGMDPGFGGIMGKINMMDHLPNAHGATGKIIKIESPDIIVEGKDNTEKTILISTDTAIQEERQKITTADLKVDDFVVAIGTPDASGIIEAKFIRVIPSPELLNK